MPLNRDHVEIRPIAKMGRNAVDSNELFLDDLFVADEDIVGEVGAGFRVILTGLNAERVLFGRPIGANQGVSFPLAEAKIRIEAADAVLQKTTALIDAQQPAAAEANYAKWLCAEAGFFAAEVGASYRHALHRTITEMDYVLFASLTMNVAPIHLDAEYAKTTVHGRALVNSLFTVALIGACHVPELTMGTTLGNLGHEEVRFPHPVFHGDTLRGETTILAKRESRSRDDSGVVTFEHRGYNQDDVLVMSFRRIGLMLTQPV